MKDSYLLHFCSQGVCTEAGMYALRERRVHVTQEDFELAVAKVSGTNLTSNYQTQQLLLLLLFTYLYSALSN